MYRRYFLAFSILFLALVIFGGIATWYHPSPVAVPSSAFPNLPSNQPTSTQYTGETSSLSEIIPPAHTQSSFFDAPNGIISTTTAHIPRVRTNTPIIPAHATTSPTHPLLRTSTGSTSFNDTSFWNDLLQLQSSVSGTTSGNTLNAYQKELHRYGNTVGKLLVSFTQTQGDQVAILTAFIAHPARTEGIQKLAVAYTALADALAAKQTPQAVRATHLELIRGYRAMASHFTQLARVDTSNSKAFVDALVTYNTSARIVAQAQIDLITLFRANNIIFKSSEPGALFMFSPLQ